MTLDATIEHNRFHCGSPHDQVVRNGKVRSHHATVEPVYDATTFDAAYDANVRAVYLRKNFADEEFRNIRRVRNRVFRLLVNAHCRPTTLKSTAQENSATGCNALSWSLLHCKYFYVNKSVGPQALLVPLWNSLELSSTARPLVPLPATEGVA